MTTIDLQKLDELSGKADQKLREFFQNEHNTILFQIIMSFTFGTLFSPWSYGFAIYLIWLFVYEIVYGLAVNFDPKVWTLDKRLGIICASFFGWILGRSLSNLHIFAEKPGEPFFGPDGTRPTSEPTSGPNFVPFGHYQSDTTHHYKPAAKIISDSSPGTTKTIWKKHKTYRTGARFTKEQRQAQINALIARMRPEHSSQTMMALKSILKELG